MINRLLAPILPFIGHPERALWVAGILVLLFLGLKALRRFAWPTLGAAIVWVLYAFWEQMVRGDNIRIDIYLIYPVLVAVTLLGLITGMLRGKS